MEKLQNNIVISPNLFCSYNKKPYLCSVIQKKRKRMRDQEAYNRLLETGIRPSKQRLAIMDWLITHPIHPTVEDVYQGLYKQIPTLSRTTVYNTLRMLSEKGAAQMITIDDHRVCYDGNPTSHVHFFCKRCGKVIDLMDEKAPQLMHEMNINGNIVQEQQLYYKGICAECANNEVVETEDNNNIKIH